MPADFPDLPEPLRRVLPAARWEAVTLGESGAQVWRSRRFVLKVQERHPRLATTLQQERERLRWLAGRIPAPQVVGYETTGTQEFLAMTRLPGIPMSDPDAALHPERMVSLLARALRELHALPPRDCPFVMTLDITLPLARERVAQGWVDEQDFDGVRQGRSAVSIFNELARTRPAPGGWHPGGWQEDLVVTHGDPCLPNFLVNGEWLEGVIDVGRLGIADRHADLALAYRSTVRNLGQAHAEALLDEYGRHLTDPARLEYYALLDELF